MMGMLSLDLGVRSIKSRRAIDSDLCTLLQACELSREQTESRGERAGGHTAGGRQVCEPGLPGRAAGSDRACRSLSPASTSPSALHSPRVGLSSHVWFWGVLPDHKPQAGSRARSAGWPSEGALSSVGVTLTFLIIFYKEPYIFSLHWVPQSTWQVSNGKP